MTDERADPELVAALTEGAQHDAETMLRAMDIVARATADPLAIAAENAALVSSQRGAYALIRALVIRAGGRVVVQTHELVVADGKLEITDGKIGIVLVVKGIE